MLNVLMSTKHARLLDPTRPLLYYNYSVHLVSSNFYVDAPHQPMIPVDLQIQSEEGHHFMGIILWSSSSAGNGKKENKGDIPDFKPALFILII